MKTTDQNNTKQAGSNEKPREAQKSSGEQKEDDVNEDDAMFDDEDFDTENNDGEDEDLDIEDSFSAEYRLEYALDYISSSL